MRNCALIIGGYVNGLSIIRELYENGVRDIWLIDHKHSISSKSNKITGFKIIKKSPIALRESLEELHITYDNIIIYPTGDNHLEWLNEIFTDIKNYCYLPFNEENLASSLDKFNQYDFCQKLGIPFPKTFTIERLIDLKNLSKMKFPILIKPSKRHDINSSLFRNIFIESNEDLEKQEQLLKKFLSKSIKFIASEFVPGDDTNIYAYTAFRNKTGKIVSDWVGKKLNQYPDNFGVFSSASNVNTPQVRDYGIKLVNEMNLYGIIEPEFKYDSRDNTFKLMEINLRSMMWHRLGTLSGVNLHYNMWLDAQNLPTKKQAQIFEKKIHFLYMKHEIVNLFFRKKYWPSFKYNLFGGDSSEFAVFMKKDIKPFLFDSFYTSKTIFSRCLKRLRKN